MRKNLIIIFGLLILLNAPAYAATRNIVPRSDGEGSIGTTSKRWGDGQFDALSVAGSLDVDSMCIREDLSVADDLFIGGSNFTVDKNIINFSDTTDEYVLAFDTTTQTWRGIVISGGGETLAETLALGADANDVDITSLDKLEGFDNAVFIDLGTDGYLDLDADTAVRLYNNGNEILTVGANGACLIGSLSLTEDIYLGGQDLIYGTTRLSLGDNGACLIGSLSLTNDFFVGNDAYIPSILGDTVFTGSAHIIHTATESDDHAFEIDVNAAGFGDVKALDIVYTTGAISAGVDEGIILINIDEILATGGDIFGVEVLTTEGAAGSTVTVYGLKAGVLVGPIHQDSGTFDNPTTATDNTTGPADVNDMKDGDSGTTTAIFEAEDEYILIGAAAAFQEIEFIITTPSSNPGIKPTFWYSTAGAHTFTAFTPTDGTNGFRNTGVVAWDASDLTAHAVNTDTGTYDIKVIRTQNNLNIEPILGYAKVATTIEYFWDKDGSLGVKSICTTGDISVGGKYYGDGSALTGVGGGGGATYREITFLPQGAVLDDDNPAVIDLVESTGTGTPRFYRAKFDDGDDDALYWDFIMPSDATASQDWILEIHSYSDEDVDENVIWAVQVSATSDNDADNVEEQIADTIDVVSENYDKIEAKALCIVSLTIDYANCDGAVAGDSVIIKFFRDGDGTGGTDDLTNEVYLLKCHLKIPRS